MSKTQILQYKTYKAGKVIYPVIAQVKKDGIWARWDAHMQNFYTRNDNLIHGVSHLREALKYEPDYDGELVVPGLTFFIMNGLIRSIKEKPDCKFFVFDAPTPGAPYSDRYDNYMARVNALDNPYVYPLKGRTITDEPGLDAFYAKALKQGFEGIVIKHIESPYYDGKKYQCQKRTPLYTIECPIIDVIEGKGKLAGMLGAFLVDYEGTPVKIGMGVGLNNKFRAYVMTRCQELPGLPLVVQYKGKTPKGSLRQPKFKAIRWDLN